MPVLAVIRELIIDHWGSAWNKWPNTDDTDFSAIRAAVHPAICASSSGDLLQIDRYYYPAYCAYAQAGHLHLPAGLPIGYIDVRKPPDAKVLRAQLETIKQYSQTCQSIRWRHGYQCYPEVSKELPGLFPIRILEFGDDCPGSSEHKTFPHAQYFNELIHNMYVWDFETGTRVSDKYIEHGLNSAHFVALCAASGTIAYAAEKGLTVEAKADLLRSGNPLPYGLVYVGCSGWLNKYRQAFNTELFQRRAEFHAVGLATRFYGQGGPDGYLEPRMPPKGSGWTTAPLYWNALLGHNYAISSIFNARLFDLWLSGVGQLIYDKNHELADFGALPDEHYIAYNGTVDDLLRQAVAWSQDRSRLADLIIRGRDKAREIMQTWSHERAFRSIYFKYLKELGL